MNNVDAEFKGLQYTLEQIIRRNAIQGSRVSIDLYTEQVPCTACSDTIPEFYDRVIDIVGDGNIRMSVSSSFENLNERKRFYGFN